MLFWGNSLEVPDTSVPRDNNANTDIKGRSLRSFLLTTYTGQYFTSELSPEQREKLRAWRPPSPGDSNYAPLDKPGMKENILRESWVKAMMLRLVRDQLNACYKDNGVNHYENCAHLSELYLKWMRQGYRVRGGNLRMKIDWKRISRNQQDAKYPTNAPENRAWKGIDGSKGNFESTLSEN